MTTNMAPQTLRAFVWHFLKPHKGVVILFVILALGAGCWGPFNSMLIKSMINILSSSQGDPLSLLVGPAGLLVVNFIVFDNITWRTIGFLNYRYQAIIKNKIIVHTFDYVLGSSHQYFQDKLSGRIASHINTLADSIERILHNISPDFMRGFSLLVIALVGTYYVHPAFFCTLALWFVIFSAFSIHMSKRLVSLSDLHTESESVISGQLVDCISNVNNITLFARRNFEVSHLENSLEQTKAAFQKKEIFLVILHSIQGFLIAIMLGIMVYFLVHFYEQKIITIGDFALILGLSMEVAHITWYTLSQVDEFHQAVGKCKQSLSNLMAPQEIQDIPQAHTLSVAKGEISFDRVKFFYKGTKPLFDNKSVRILPGEKVGLVGFSGSGKSTFVSLILRIYDVTDGKILIDGQDIRCVTQESLRQNIAMIPQEPSLFHRTIGENIRYGRKDATDEEVIQAAKQAHAHDFIVKFPKGYNSPVGERGVKLSGGQRQRIAIARAILKNAPLLILDEATSQLDSVTERDIQASMEILMQDKTTLIIAHRLSTLLHMDRILVFDQGKIVQDGIHAQLIKESGLYKTLWDAQVGGFLPDKKVALDL